MRALGIVPARGGSKRVPRKNLRPLGGRPLVAWSLEAATRARGLAQVVLSSDDEEILSLAARFPSAVALRRPDDISSDTAPALTYVEHALDARREAGEDAYDAVVIVQPSSPFTTPEDIDAVIALLDRTQADSAVSVMQVDHATHPLKMKRMDGDKLLPYLEEERGRMSEHELPKVFVRNGSVYASLRRTIEAGSILGADSRGYVMPRERSVDINDELDLAFCEFLLGRHVGATLGPTSRTERVS